MLAAAAAPSGSDAVAAAVVVAALLVRQVAVGRAHLAHRRLAVARHLLHPLRLWRLPSPRVVVESEGPFHLPCQWFSAATARSSPRAVRPTSARARSTRSRPNGRT